MATSPSGRQTSRFSSLNVFKIAGSSSKAPPPPPKDPYYLPNHSLVSLSTTVAPQETQSQPITPIYSRYAASARSPSPSPSYSTSHHAPSTSTLLSPPPATNGALSPDSAGSKRGFRLPSFTRRPKTPKSAKSEPVVPPSPAEDPSISMPWNFQHNIHVDEGFSGLPPTWSASLAELGFSPDEIAVINARRAAARSPTLTPLHAQGFHGRNDSIASSTLSHVQPRSSSLQRDLSDDGMSMSQRSTIIAPSVHARTDSDVSRTHSVVTTETPYEQVVYVRPSPRSTQTPSLRMRSGSTGTPPASNSPSSTGRPIPAPSTPVSARAPRGMSPSSAQRQLFTGSPLGNGQSPLSQTVQLPPNRMQTSSPQPASSWSTPSEKDKPPRTPPRRMHVVNDSVSSITSPPPAYKSPKRQASSLEDDNSDREEANSAEAEPVGDLPPSPESAVRLPARPPRLSLHQDDLVDLSSWTESLFSIIPAQEKHSSPQKTHSQPRPTASLSTESPSGASSSRSQLDPRSKLVASTQPMARQLPPQKPPPLQPLPAPNPRSLPSIPVSQESESQNDESSTLLFNEVLSMVSPDKEFEDPMSKPWCRDKENRDSNMSTMTVTPATIVRDAAVVTRARANVILAGDMESIHSARTSSPAPDSDESDDSEGRSDTPSTSSSHSSGTSISASGSTSSGPSRSPGSIPYVESASPLPSPLAGTFAKAAISPAAVRQIRNSASPALAMQAIDKTNASVEEDARIPSPYSSSAATSPSGTPLYPGWVTELVSPIQKFLTDRVDPRSLFVDLQEIAEGESGSVFSARVVNRPAGGKELVAIKNVTLVPSGTPKLADLARELTVLQDVSHPHILCMDALYVDFDDDALWIRMELMDRSLADVIAMIEEGVMLQEKHMALVAKDVLSALDYMRRLGIAHRDVRSDNLLISPEGLVRIADFSNAVRVPLLEPSRSDPAGVPYWQAPEVRSGTYNALKVDVWSLGATLWEVAETVPPFSDATDLSELGDRWPPLSQSEVYSRSFHDFLHLCSEPSSSRPDPHDLFNTPFIRNAGNRSSFLEILAQCKSIELSSRRQSTDTIS